MKAIILAAGQGTRLKKYTEGLPKGMLEVDGKTIIKRQIDLYRECSIDKIIIVRGYSSNKINYPKIKYYNNFDFENTNMVESLMCAKSEFDDDCIVSYSDILFEKSMLQDMMKSNFDFSVAVDNEWKSYWIARYGKIDFDTESLKLSGNNIIELGKENPELKNIDARYIGLLKFSKNGLKIIVDLLNSAYKEFENKPWQQSGKTIRKAYMTDLLNALIESKYEVKAIPFNNGWIEFDTNQDYEIITDLLKKEIINLNNISFNSYKENI